MKILLVNSAYDPALADFTGLIESYFTLSGWAEGLCRAGAKVSVLQRFKYPGVIDCNKVLYHFTSDGLAPGLRWWQLPVGFLSRATHWAVQARREDPEVVIHFNGLLFPLQTWWLRRVLPRDCAVVGQHHAEPPMSAWRGDIQRLGLAGVDRFLFNSCEQAKPWVQQGIICSLDLVDAVPEGSSPLTWRERATYSPVK